LEIAFLRKMLTSLLRATFEEICQEKSLCAFAGIILTRALFLFIIIN
jgi:hypothetical protein